VAQLAAALLLIFGLLPIANWIPGGHDAPWYSQRVGEWISGGSIILGVAVISTIMFKSRPQLWREGAWARIAARWRRGDRGADLAIALVVLAVCAVVSQVVLSARPLLIDEIISVYQARILASGHLVQPAPQWTEFSSAMHLLDWNGRVFGQFPVGGPAMLAIGTLVHAEWLVGPIATAIGAFLFARLLRRLPLRDGTALAALLLYGLAPFTVFLGGSMMNHVTATMWILAATLALAIATTDDTARSKAAFVMGLSFGIAATIRPTDAAAFAIPAAIWLAWRARVGTPHVRALLLSGVGVMLPMALLLYVNAHQTGHALRFGYIEMWGKSHELGFHQAPWGDAHTPARGLELISLYFLRLQDYFLETAGPSLLFATGALALAPRLRGFDRWALAGCGMLILGYFAYWHDGFYLGPRFMLPLTPWLALWTARLPAMMELRRVALPVMRGVVVAGTVALLIGMTVAVPLRARQYTNGMTSVRLDIDSAATASGVRNALVLVRESWGAQMMAQMWGLGVTRMDAEHIYRTNDACQMQTAIRETEADGSGATGLQHRLAAHRSDSAKLVTVPDLPDTTVRFVPGALLTERCVRRIAEDRAGFTMYPPFLLARGNGNIYLRDLHARDSLLLKQYAGRDIWLVTREPRVGSPFRFEKVSRDSMLADWAKD
jgi:4-amino-4-deoxy-L-arabinose transferase-like glycosyltransferase